MARPAEKFGSRGGAEHAEKSFPGGERSVCPPSKEFSSLIGRVILRSSNILRELRASARTKLCYCRYMLWPAPQGSGE